MSAVTDITGTGHPGGARRLGDRVFQGLATGAGVLILVVLAGVAGFLLIEAWPAITANAADIPGGEGLVKYIWPLAFGTLVAATIAIIFAVPMAVAVALFNYIVSPEGQAAAAKNAGSAPLSDALRKQVQPAVDAIG